MFAFATTSAEGAKTRFSDKKVSVFSKPRLLIVCYPLCLTRYQVLFTTTTLFLANWLFVYPTMTKYITWNLCETTYVTAPRERCVFAAIFTWSTSQRAGQAIGPTGREKADLLELSSPARAVYQARIAVMTPSQPPSVTNVLDPVRFPIARQRKVRVRTANTAIRATLLLNVPMNMIAVNIVQPRRKRPRACGRTPALTSSAAMPLPGRRVKPMASQNAP